MFSLDIHMLIKGILKKIITTKTLEIEKIHVNNRLEDMAKMNARLLSQYEKYYQTVFSATFYKQQEGDQVIDEIEF